MVRGDLPAFAIGLLLLFVITALELLGPWILKHAVDGPVAEGMAEGSTGRAIRELLGFAGVFLGVVVATLVARYAQFIVLNRAGQRVLHRIRSRVFTHLQRLPIAFYDKNAVGRLVTRVTSDVETLNELFTSGAVTLIADVVKIAVLLGVVFTLNARLALIAVIAIPALGLASAFFRIRARQAYRETRTAIARVTSYLGETISGVRVLHGFAREDKAQRNFAERNRAYLTTNLKTVFYFALFFPVVDWIALAIQGGVFWRAGIEIAGERMTVGGFLQFWYYLNFIFEPLRELAERYNVLQSAMASAERIFHVLDEAPEAADPASPRSAAHLRGAVRFEDVSFSYRPGEPVLKGITFAAEPGETIALVGATGGGKTTITALLTRFYEAERGRILLDGADVREYARRELRARIAYVPQDVFLFTGTVLDNLRAGSAAVTEERAILAARAIGAETFIERFPGGYRYALAERGSNLSAGERQMLSFARALATDPSILILDEATASVDPESEAILQRAIAKLLEGRTSIVVAHRLSTIRRASKILVLHHGELRESGTHEELIAKRGLYSRLYSLQFQGSEEAGRLVGKP